MNLTDLEGYDSITIQCHDNPDADAIASGFGLLCYFLNKGKKARLVYSGRGPVSKSNLLLMIEKLDIPITYIKPTPNQPYRVDGLLITVDCQYGAGNVTGITGEKVAIIDHHQVEIDNVENSLILPSLGSCSTLVWKLLKEQEFDFNKAPGLGTALYYGLFTDTNQMSEIRHPLDMDMREDLVYDNALILLFSNCNLSLKELEIAGVAMTKYTFHDTHKFAVIMAQPCDPNILGVISDFFLQVDVIQSCMVFNETGDGYKISVRSCVREVNAGELAAYLTKGIGSGGGHYSKAGGYVSRSLYEKQYGELPISDYFYRRMEEYFEFFRLIYADCYEADPTEMKVYTKKNLPIGYIKADELIPVGTPITIRTLEGDMDLVVEDDLYIIIGIKGEVYPNRREKFERSYRTTGEAYRLEDCAVSADYIPTIKNRENGQNMLITAYAKVCIPTGKVSIYAKELDCGVKVFTSWDKEKYMLGKPGDYLAARLDDLHDVYVIERDIFFKSYEEKV